MFVIAANRSHYLWYWNNTIWWEGAVYLVQFRWKFEIENMFVIHLLTAIESSCTPLCTNINMQKYTLFDCQYFKAKFCEEGKDVINDSFRNSITFWYVLSSGGIDTFWDYFMNVHRNVQALPIAVNQCLKCSLKITNTNDHWKYMYSVDIHLTIDVHWTFDWKQNLGGIINCHIYLTG